MYPFAQFVVISVNFISFRSLRTRPGVVRVVVTVPLEVVVVILTSFFILSTTMVVVPVDAVVPVEVAPLETTAIAHFPS